MAIFTILILPIREHGMFFSFVYVFSYFLEQWFLVLLEEVLHVPCMLYFQVFNSLCSHCDMEFTHDLSLSVN